MDMKQNIDEFLLEYFPNMDELKAHHITDEEFLVINQIVSYVEERLSGMKYILGLSLDFLILGQQLAKKQVTYNKFHDKLTLEFMFSDFQLVTKRGKKDANTLTLLYGNESYGIRKIEEKILEFFHTNNFTQYPSAYVYNTGQWQKFQDQLLNCFKLSDAGKLQACLKLFELGVSNFTANNFWVRAEPRVRIFDELLKKEKFPRTARNENGGLILQALVFGYLSADRPHLSFVADKVRTGSSRQKRFGDIDAYFGPDLELSAEVKDIDLDMDNIKKQCQTFLILSQQSKICGIIFCETITSEARDYVENYGCIAISCSELLRVIKVWDWRKQDNAFNSFFHFICHIEQNADAANRVLDFVRDLDNTHSVLAYEQSG